MYIKTTRRMAIDPIIDGLVKRLRSIDADRHDVAYAITRVTMEALRPEARWTLQTLNDCVNALYEAASEIETRMVQPYTEEAIRLNGDLECFQDPLAVFTPNQPGVPDTFNNLGVQPGRRKGLKPVSEAFSDEQIKAVEEDRDVQDTE